MVGIVKKNLPWGVVFNKSCRPAVCSYAENWTFLHMTFKDFIFMYTSVSLVPKRVFITYILWDFREPWIHSQALPVSSQAPSPICKECTITRKCHVCAPEDSTPPSKSIKVSKNCPKLIRMLHPPPPPPPWPSNQNWNSILKVRGTQNLYFNWPIKCSIVQGTWTIPETIQYGALILAVTLANTTTISLSLFPHPPRRNPNI